MFDFLKKRNSETAPPPSAVNTEQIEYALQFESVLSNMEAHFRNSMDYRGVGINALKMVCEFYNGDWAGVILAELDLSIWRPHWWYKPEDIDRTDELVHEFESCEGLERWIQCIRDNEPLVVSDIEAIKDSYPVEYDLYKRLLIDSFIAVPITPKPTGCLVVRNPKKFVNQTSFLKMVSYVIGSTILETQLEESRKMMVAPKHIQNPNEIVIKLFGSIEIYTSRGVIYEEQIKSPKLCKLLVYLLLSKKTLHQPMAIADSLWPDDERDSEKICSNLRGLVYRFRRTFQLISDEDLIVSTQAGYRLNPKLKIMTDFDQFDKLGKEACQAPGKVRRMELMKQAIKLYKGEFFASTNSEEWLQPVARSYTLRYMHLINEVLSTLAEVGDIAGVHHYAQKGIDHAPENVKAHFWLIHSVRCGVAPELARAELEWSKERLTEEEYADLLELLAKTEQPDMTLNVKI